MPSNDTSEKIFAQWMRDHRGILTKVSRSFARETVDQNELVQEMMFQMWQSLPRFQGGAKPSTWIYRICLNTAMQWRRTTERRQRWIEPKADFAAMAAESDSPAESVAQRELLAQLYASIQLIPAFDRALVLLALDGLAYREIAEVTGLTENHVGVALTRARQRLAELMKGVVDELG